MSLSTSADEGSAALNCINNIFTVIHVWSTKHRSQAIWELLLTGSMIHLQFYIIYLSDLSCLKQQADVLLEHTCTMEQPLSSATVIHNEFGPTFDKIAATISDNGSNFVKAFKEFSVAIVHSRDAIVMVIKLRKDAFKTALVVESLVIVLF